MAPTQPPLELEPTQADAGKAFVLESKGTWLHAGYHLTAATAGPPLLALPFAMSHLGWGPGIFTLLLAAAVTFYECFLLSITTEELNSQGLQCFRFWDVASHVMGPTWAHYFVAPLQYVLCYVVVIALILLGGGTLEAVFSAALSNGGHVRLYYYTAIFGAFALVLSQLPSFHSLRFFNLLSMLLCLGFSICTVGGSIIAGLSDEAPPKDYSVHGSPLHVMFGTFNAISITLTAYANPLIVEIQATLLPPPTSKMLKGLLVCYSVSLLTFLSVSISGYWAFGSSAKGLVFDNMKSLVPKWLFILSNAFACLQLIGATAVYMQPLFAKYEGLVINVNMGWFSPRNLFLRLILVLLWVRLDLCHYASFCLIGSVAAVRQIVLDVNMYKIFPST
ncbi:hypothetical protein GOP47_0025756 [Adiantum capillus-veneris]|uniref:Amino acid transporter transmembrane domain-containing protein n=1 Tax=Adiantum capillus-veneris TaxID=13818 RepID=A0A9D4Z3U6_ADICA|nr:hypothetical protein GOP47_0025756 [Adiantum capillus-veneris]